MDSSHCLDLFCEICFKVEELFALLREAFDYCSTGQEDPVPSLTNGSTQLQTADLGPGQSLEDMLQGKQYK